MKYVQVREQQQYTSLQTAGKRLAREILNTERSATTTPKSAVTATSASKANNSNNNRKFHNLNAPRHTPEGYSVKPCS